jgi:hypothetical protein
VRIVDGIDGNSESIAGSPFPDVLLVVVVLGDDLYAHCDEACRVETDTELPIMEMSASEVRASMRP